MAAEDYTPRPSTHSVRAGTASHGRIPLAVAVEMAGCDLMPGKAGGVSHLRLEVPSQLPMRMTVLTTIRDVLSRPLL